MRILMVHNYYQFAGGEDIAFESEAALLLRKGHKVIQYTDRNSRIPDFTKVELAINTIWSTKSYHRLLEVMLKEKPDLVHFHNIFPLISPSVYYACHSLEIPIIQTIHNYRIGCPVATFYRDGVVCEACLGKTFAYPGVLYKCYRNSHLQTIITASMLAFHKLRNTWDKFVDVFIALTEFSSLKLSQAGLPASKISVKPNFIVSDTEFDRKNEGSYALFASRLSREKGLSTLLTAWSTIPDIPLIIVGDGPLRNTLEQYRGAERAIAYLGYIDHENVLSLMRDARFLVFPSEWYEVFPLAIIEAFACGLPVIAPNLGSIPEIIQEGKTGLLFTPSDPNSLAAKVNWLWHHPKESSRMGRQARLEYESKYTPDINYQLLMGIYAKVSPSARNT